MANKPLDLASTVAQDLKAAMVAWTWAIIGGAAATLWLTFTQGNWPLRVAVGIGLVLVAIVLGRTVEHLQQRRRGRDGHVR